MAEHFCVTHAAVWFKKGKMKGYAHPIKDGDGETIGWCNEDAKEVAKLPPQPSDKVLPEHQKVIDEAVKGTTPTRTSSTNEGIEAQVAFKGMIELMATGVLKPNSIEAKATLDWAMSRIALPSVIIEKIEEAKDASLKITETQTHKATNTNKQAPADEEVVDEARPKTIGEFLTWLKDHGKKAPRTYLEVEWEISRDAVLNVEKCLELYDEIKQKEGW